ncbi:MAG: rhodanese-like domain-containing protein [Campylobacterota bacterium]|nr:rhodanese-like domain-containing protein [Campylobacterota bacterium]
MKKIIIGTLLFAGLLFANEAYKPVFDKVTIAGAEIYVLGDDKEEAIEEGQIDQNWFAELINSKKPLPKNLTLVDLRKVERYNAQHIEGSVNIPFDMDTEKMDLSKLPKDGLIVFYCRKGMMSTAARASLEDELAERTFVFDATYKCDKKEDGYKNCVLTPNEFL